MRISSILPTVFLAAAWTACVASAQAQQIVKFPATDSDTAQPVNLRAELFKPVGTGPFPAVILMHGCGGWQPAVHYALQAHADFLTKHGFVVLDLDSFGPRDYSGDALCASDARLREALIYRAYDAFDAMRYLAAQAFVEARDIFLMGQSNGGSVALEVARANGVRRYNSGGTAFRAVVAYYPWCGVFSGSVPQLVSPLLVFSGGRDDWVSTRECERSRTNGEDYRVQVYPEAAHSFDVDVLPERYMGHLIGYDEPAAIDSDNKMLAFFEDHLTKSLKAQHMTPIIAESGGDQK